MIGVCAEPAEFDVIREFFELFKTPWEFYQHNHDYDVLICSGENRAVANARLIVIYAGKKVDFDDQTGISVCSHLTPCVLSYQGDQIPIYGNAITFEGSAAELLTDEKARRNLAYVCHRNGTKLARVGYDLFGEIQTLLTAGQPPANAGIPTLELHIEFLRNLIAASGISFVEIPPVPEGFQLITCLTHDVDHPAIRQHKWDHTIAGFLFRATIGGAIAVLQRRLSVRDAVKNCVAAVKLPLVYMGIAKDFWRDFDDRYLEVEQGLPSTFFIIPFKNDAGKTTHGPAPTFRAAQYQAKDLADSIEKLTIGGCEVGLHGLDAWLDSSAACKELDEIRHLTRRDEIGVRMHWLYWNENSPAVLEKAGASYDSTVGYNQTVGYRAGTTQGYRPLGTDRLLELPLHGMDTALFYPTHLGLSGRQARQRLHSMVDVVVRYGGCLTINWHDRSLAPERLWGSCYRELIEALKQRGAWFATAAQAVSWFRKRRSAIFEMDSGEPRPVRVLITGTHDARLPPLRLRIHKGQEDASVRLQHSCDYVDMPVAASAPTIALHS